MSNESVNCSSIWRLVRRSKTLWTLSILVVFKVKVAEAEQDTPVEEVTFLR